MHHLIVEEITGQIKKYLLPEGRAIATAATFDLMLKNSPSLDEGSLRKALMILKKEKSESEPPQISARRQTCLDVEEFCGDIYGGRILTAVKGWSEWVEYLRGQICIIPDDQKGRYLAMLATAERELIELQNEVNNYA